jgi:hypothetical protein
MLAQSEGSCLYMQQFWAAVATAKCAIDLTWLSMALSDERHRDSS